MEKYRRYAGVIIFIAAVVCVTFFLSMFIKTKYNEYTALKTKQENVAKTLEDKKAVKLNIEKKIARLNRSVMSAQKRIYSPVEGNTENDTLFFTLYSDLIEMVHSNSIKIDSIEYNYNPQGDVFVAQGAKYFVCDVNLKLVSNYVNLGKLVQDLYQYPYYIKINNIEVYPYPKDKKILLTTLSVRLYAHTAPDELMESSAEESQNPEQKIDGAEKPIPQG